MSSKRESDKLIKEIIQTIGFEPLAISRLARRVGTNFDSAKTHVLLLKDLGIVYGKEIVDPSNKHDSTIYSLTEQGQKAYKVLKKQN